MIYPLPKLIVQITNFGFPAVRTQVEVPVASPEPAVGVFTPAGTRPGRLWRHCVIGSPTLERTSLPSGPAAVGEGSGQGSNAVGARVHTPKW
jgi:hypothetical protein